MNATIDIKTPAGKSLEGFPQNFKTEEDTVESVLLDSVVESNFISMRSKLNKGDKITIEVKE